MATYLADILERVRRRFYADNFKDIYVLAAEASRAVDHPAPFFIIWRIFLSLDDYWRERPMTAKTGERMAEVLRPPLERYLEAAQPGLSPEVEAAYLDEIVRTFLDWLDLQDRIPHAGDPPL